VLTITLSLACTSLLGTSLRVYVGHVATGELEPSLTNRPGSDVINLPRDLLEGGWDIDILSEEGFIEMKEIVGDILAQCYRAGVCQVWFIRSGRRLSPISNVQIIHKPNVHENGVICTRLSLKMYFMFIQDLQDAWDVLWTK